MMCWICSQTSLQLTHYQMYCKQTRFPRLPNSAAARKPVQAINVFMSLDKFRMSKVDSAETPKKSAIVNGAFYSGVN